MKNFLNDSWEYFNDVQKEKKVYLFGLNSAVKIIEECQRYDSPWNITAIIDNDTEKHGEICVGQRKYGVYSLKELVDEIEAGIVLICGTYTKDIASQLENFGIRNYYSEFWMNRPTKLKVDIVPQVIDDEKIDQVKSLLYDEYSKDLINTIVSRRKCGDIDYTDIMRRGGGESEYFIDEFWTPFENGVYVDGGAFNGDTIDEIAYWTKNDFRKIYSFEPQSNLSEYIRNKVLWKYGKRIDFYDKGLWSEETVLNFENGDHAVSGKINISAGNEIHTCTIDDVVREKVSFIKLDIEGAEVEALKGGKKVITRDKPCMAICIYHKVTDLWEVPLLIHEMVPEYKFFVRHCGASMYGTILYAKI